MDRETDALVLQKLQQWQDIKFGLFMHWGIPSVWGAVESWPIVNDEPYGREALKQWTDCGKDPDAFMQQYFALAQQFAPTAFDPQEWVETAKTAGMKYVIFTTKHHDGFCMWDTSLTDYKITNPSCPFSSNPRADIVKAVYDAFRAEGFKTGFYYSKPDWHCEHYWSPDKPRRSKFANYDTTEDPAKWQRFKQYVHGQIEELMQNYGPADILWLDGDWVRAPKEDIDMAGIAAMSRKYWPGLIMVDRAVGGRYENYQTPEQKVPDKPLDGPWETCMTMGEQWSWKPNENYKTTRELIHLLVDVVCKGGNLLLNVGPGPDGRLDAQAVQRLQQIGSWMQVNGDAIYSTRPIEPYKEGSVCLTQKDDKIYAICLADPDQQIVPARINVPSIRTAKSVRMLGADTTLDWNTSDSGLTISIPQHLRDNLPCEHAWTFEITKA